MDGYKLTLNLTCDPNNTTVEPEGWSTRWTASIETNIPNGSASIRRKEDQSGRGTWNDIPMWAVNFDPAGITERPRFPNQFGNGIAEHDCAYNLDLSHTNRVYWSEQDSSGDDCDSGWGCVVQGTLEGLGYIPQDGSIGVLRLPCEEGEET
jgi:hypothetical protein